MHTSAVAVRGALTVHGIRMDQRKAETIEIINAATGATIMISEYFMPVDLTPNSTFMLALLFVAAKRLNIPRAWLVVLAPQASAVNWHRVPILRQTPSDETMDALFREDNHCVLCGDPGEPDLYDSDACVACSPLCLCRPCKVQGIEGNYCLACVTPEMAKLLPSQQRRLEALNAYWSGP